MPDALERPELDSVVSVPMVDRKFFATDEVLAGDNTHAARVGMWSARHADRRLRLQKLATVIDIDIREHEVVNLDSSEAIYIDDSAVWR